MTDKVDANFLGTLEARAGAPPAVKFLPVCPRCQSCVYHPSRGGCECLECGERFVILRIDPATAEQPARVVTGPLPPTRLRSES